MAGTTHTKTYDYCLVLVNSARTTGLWDKLDIFLLAERITGDEYLELTGMLTAA